MQISIYLMLFISSIISQSNGRGQQAAPIKIEDFDMIVWKADSLGCQRKRLGLYRILINNKQKIINHSKTEVESLLGIANVVSNSRRSEFYYLESGIQCTPLKKDKDGLVDAAQLVISYRDGKVVDVLAVIP